MTRALIAVALAALLTLLALASTGPDGGPESERARVSAHLARVEHELRAADVSHLDAEQRAARVAALDELRAYRMAGRFPHNHGESAARVPVFVDMHGTHCAVGHLLAVTGETELVERIRSTRNLARVPDLAGEPGLAEWLDANGLTVEEAAHIQPAYDFLNNEERDGRYATTTAALTAASAVAATWNVLSDRTGENWYMPAAAGILSGAASIGWGLHGLEREKIEMRFPAGEVTRKPADIDVAFNFVAGAVAALLGTRTLALGRADGPEATRTQQGAAARLELTPTARGFTGTIRF